MWLYCVLVLLKHRGLCIMILLALAFFQIVCNDIDVPFPSIFVDMKFDFNYSVEEKHNSSTGFASIVKRFEVWLLKFMFLFEFEQMKFRRVF